MACRGVHFAIQEGTAARLLDAESDDDLVRVVQEEIEGVWDKDHLFETDKAWDALHRCLSDGTLNVTGGTPPLNLCFFGGYVLNRTSDYFVVLLKPDQVADVARAMRAVTKEWLRERYATLDFPQYDGEKSSGDFEYAWKWFAGLPDFFERAAVAGRHVVFTVDQ